MQDKSTSKYWFVLYTHSRCEFKVEESLKALGITNYIPTKKTLRKWSDRKKEITLPLFAGYVFINATEKERLVSLEIKQVARCLTNAGKPSVVPEWQIESLKRMIAISSHINVIDGLTLGEEIEIKSGALKGVRGIILSIENKKHLAVSIELLNRSVVTYLSDESIIVE
jgi:transcription antitermination factor NusG